MAPGAAPAGAALGLVVGTEGGAYAEAATDPVGLPANAEGAGPGELGAGPRGVACALQVGVRGRQGCCTGAEGDYGFAAGRRRALLASYWRHGGPKRKVRSWQS